MNEGELENARDYLYRIQITEMYNRRYEKFSNNHRRIAYKHIHLNPLVYFIRKARQKQRQIVDDYIQDDEISQYNQSLK